MISSSPSINGLLLVDKPCGPTSYDIIRVVKRQLRGIKIGHCGTLDPNASGLLILLFGKATKKQSLYMGHDKVYRAKIRLGIKTDSADITGKIIEESTPPSFEKESILQAMNTLVGQREQMPPMFSALKVGGTPLYKLARKGQVVERKSRLVRISSIELLNYEAPNHLDVRVHCSSGTYIRTLAEEIGEKLGTVATLAELVRETIGEFHIANAMRGDDLFKSDGAGICQRIQPIS